MVFQSLSPKYELHSKLTGHQDAILCLAVSHNGSLLASGGLDGLRIWDLQRRIQTPRPNQTRNPRDPITCVAWLTGKDNSLHTLCAGTGLGYIMMWTQRTNALTEFVEVFSRRIGTGQEVMNLTCETGDANPRILTATRDRRVQLWTLDSKHNLSNVFSIELESTVPRKLCFHGGDIMVFGMYDGEIYTLRGKDGTIIGAQSTGRMIGGAAVDQTHTYFVIDNAVTGFSLHCLDDGTCVQTYDTNPTKTYPKQVAFLERGEVIVGGGENGKVFVFRARNGEVIQTLRHSNTGRVQTISTHEGNDCCLIIAASSSNESDAKITIWKKHMMQSSKQKDSEASMTWGLLKKFVQVLTHLLAIAMIIMILSSQTIIFREWGSRIGIDHLRRRYNDHDHQDFEELGNTFQRVQDAETTNEMGSQVALHDGHLDGFWTVIDQVE